MSKVRILSMDPSMSNTAVVWGTYDSETGEVSFEGYDICITEKSKNKSVLVASDTVNRAKKTVQFIKEKLENVKPQVCFVELPSGSVSASAMKSYGLSCAYIALLEPNAVQVTPQQVKNVLGVKGKVSKRQIIDFCKQHFPDFPYETKKDGTIVVGRMEHVCDSMVIALAGMKTSQFNQIKNFI